MHKGSQKHSCAVPVSPRVTKLGWPEFIITNKKVRCLQRGTISSYHATFDRQSQKLYREITTNTCNRHLEMLPWAQNHKLLNLNSNSCFQNTADWPPQPPLSQSSILSTCWGLSLKPAHRWVLNTYIYSPVLLLPPSVLSPREVME